jgi:hypothetical protein
MHNRFPSRRRVALPFLQQALGPPQHAMRPHDGSIREIAVAAQRLQGSLLYRSPRFSRRSRALLSAFKRCLRRMLASDLVRALANRCLREIFFVRLVPSVCFARLISSKICPRPK